jgi:mono/diheme cytochrome c family protein
VALACLPAIALAACGGGGTATVKPAATATATVPVPGTRSIVKADAQPPPGLTAAQQRAFVAGRGVLEDKGCLACHRIGTSGLGTGPDLTIIGSTAPRKALRRALVSPTSPMPSYAKLPARDLDALVSFLSRLTLDIHGGLRCPRGSDCG